MRESSQNPKSLAEGTTVRFFCAAIKHAKAAPVATL
jgi:hypothetical protein